MDRAESEHAAGLRTGACRGRGQFRAQDGLIVPLRRVRFAASRMSTSNAAAWLRP